MDRPATAAATTGNQPAARTIPSSHGLMLARIAHELYWLGRNLARAEFTARAVEAVFQAELQGASDRVPGVSFGSHGLLAMLGNTEVEGETGGNGRALGGLTLDARRPGSMLASVQRAREGA